MRTAILLWLMPVWAFPQSKEVVCINDAVAQIDRNPSLSCDSVEASSIYGVDFDGGGEVLYCYRGKKLVKIREEIGLSWGRSSTEYYFHNDTIMLFRVCEELFPWTVDSSGLDHTRLFTSYEGAHYLRTWRNELQVIERGVRAWSGPHDEAEMNLSRLLLRRRRE